MILRAFRKLQKIFDEVYSVLRTDSGQPYDARDRNWTITETLNVNVNIPKTFKTAKIDHATSGDNIIVSAVTGKKIKVYSVVLVVSGAVNCIWKSGANNLSGDMNFNAKGEGYAQSVQPPAFLMATNVGEALILNLSGAVAVDGIVSYWDDDST